MRVGAERFQHTDRRDDQVLEIEQAAFSLGGGTLRVQSNTVHVTETQLGLHMDRNAFVRFLNEIIDTYAEDLHDIEIDPAPGMFIGNFRRVSIDDLIVTDDNALEVRISGRVRLALWRLSYSPDVHIHLRLRIEIPIETHPLDGDVTLLIRPLRLQIDGWRGEVNRLSFNILREIARRQAPEDRSEIAIEWPLRDLLETGASGDIVTLLQQMVVHQLDIDTEEDENRIRLTVSGHFP